MQRTESDYKSVAKHQKDGEHEMRRDQSLMYKARRWRGQVDCSLLLVRALACVRTPVDVRPLLLLLLLVALIWD